MAANTELFDGKYTVADLRAMIAGGQITQASESYKPAMAFMELRAGEEAKTAEARAAEARQSAISSARAQRWAVRIAITALLVSLGAIGLSVVALSESHIHAPARP